MTTPAFESDPVAVRTTQLRGRRRGYGSTQTRLGSLASALMSEGPAHGLISTAGPCWSPGHLDAGSGAAGRRTVASSSLVRDWMPGRQPAAPSAKSMDGRRSSIGSVAARTHRLDVDGPAPRHAAAGAPAATLPTARGRQRVLPPGVMAVERAAASRCTSYSFLGGRCLHERSRDAVGRDVRSRITERMPVLTGLCAQYSGVGDVASDPIQARSRGIRAVRGPADRG